MEERETIASPITLQGNSAVSVIRLSGGTAMAVIRELAGIKDPAHHHVYVKNIIFKNQIIDKAVISIFLSPDSYTGEDVVELSVHGGFASASRIMSVLSKLNVRCAEKGEFTRRAFLNGKIDLMQAEAVLQMINAKTEESASRAMSVLDGNLSKKIEELKEKVIDLKSEVQGFIDFPDDMKMSKSGYINSLNRIKDEVENLYIEGKSGYIIGAGLNVLIAGRTNCGKSTLFNAILKKERSIVSDEEGTTRDFISEWIDMDGIPVHMFDTCGIRETVSSIEKRGIEIVYELAQKADIIILLFDLSSGFNGEDEEILEKIKSKPYIIAGNKSDLAPEPSNPKNINYIPVSALSGENIDLIISRIKEFAGYSNSPNGLIMSEREIGIISEVKAVLSEIEKMDIEKEAEIIDEKLSDIISRTKNLFGSIDNEDVLNNIFSKFCVGK